MDERAEDMLIALYLIGRKSAKFSNADIDKCSKILEIIRRVREELNKEA